ncbi:hypothetical protein JCM19302_2798 [Jejuia pallidilutea]|uniref:Uncharacterized protein n=1 Tax=Jejuia pallidilutea TaxID=504487 RepID=A0A090W1W8_9FLAO|nr:hypothetical protein JCM19302_2798 [Jejuia pallidilutea]
MEEEAIDYSYDSKKNEFTFSDLRYDTEWITFLPREHVLKLIEL